MKKKFSRVVDGVFFTALIIFLITPIRTHTNDVYHHLSHCKHCSHVMLCSCAINIVDMFSRYPIQDYDWTNEKDFENKKPLYRVCSWFTCL
ncbi:hypothetical protein DERP_001131 [Dermatophagoides pteronyssinus]|uniref:Uncharacterized protein n=1 Tax=Dermatophagoides pteronyssinus TaxID=6956 RepID=A0ABQ8JEB7_DERPT|nr:hypothetical protein DERP_001131 [Dermatophagoides pteronyssinus]